MIKAVQRSSLILAVGVTLAALAWVANIIAFVHTPPNESVELPVLLIGLAYWTFSLPGMALLLMVTRIAVIAYLPLTLVPPPLLASTAMFDWHQFAASIVATLMSAALYIGVAHASDRFCFRHRMQRHRIIVSLLVGYCATGALLPLLSYQTSPRHDVLRGIARPIARGFALTGQVYPFSPAFGGTSLQFSLSASSHVIITAVIVYGGIVAVAHSIRWLSGRRAPK